MSGNQYAAGLKMSRIDKQLNLIALHFSQVLNIPSEVHIGKKYIFNYLRLQLVTIWHVYTFYIDWIFQIHNYGENLWKILLSLL